jgi:hypothetical protein
MWVAFLIPLFYLQGATQGLDGETFWRRFKKGFKFSKNHYAKTMGILLLIGAFVVILAQPIAFVFSIHEGFGSKPLVSDLLDMLADLVKRVATEFSDEPIFYSNVARQIVYLLFMLGIVPLIAISTGFSYFSESEKTEAKGLRKAFEKFGKRNRYQEKPADFE